MNDEQACFGKCNSCGKLRWVSEEALSRGIGWSCKRCGSKPITEVRSLNPLQRLYLIKWTFWEHLKINPGEKWYLNPLNVLRIIRMGWNPKLGMTDEQEIPDDAEPAQPSHSGT